MLLIDEVHSLARDDEPDFTGEANETLFKLMEDLRVDLVVIVASYPDEMTDDELVEIFCRLKRADWSPSPSRTTSS